MINTMIVIMPSDLRAQRNGKFEMFLFILPRELATVGIGTQPIYLYQYNIQSDSFIREHSLFHKILTFFKIFIFMIVIKI